MPVASKTCGESELMVKEDFSQLLVGPKVHHASKQGKCRETRKAEDSDDTMSGLSHKEKKATWLTSETPLGSSYTSPASFTGVEQNHLQGFYVYSHMLSCIMIT